MTKITDMTEMKGLPRVPEMKRVLIIGVCGAGKSTLALKIHQKTGLPLIHLDQQFWKPGWVETASEEWRSKVTELVARDAWIIDGNFASSLDIRIPRADTVIYLDYPRSIALTRVIKRTLQSRGRVRVDMAEDCPERFNWALLRFVWTFHRVHRPKIEAALRMIRDDQKLIRLTRPRAADQLLEGI